MTGLRGNLRNLAAWGGSHWLRLSGQGERNRRQFAEGCTGLRILHMHNTYADELPRLRALVEFCRRHYRLGGPADVDAFSEGHFDDRDRDTVVFSFDDGNDNNFLAGQLLSEYGIGGLFFVVPPFLERTTEEFVEYHRRQGVQAHPLGIRNRVQPARGLTRQQVREMAAAGHRLAGHPYAHRNLAQLHTTADLDYEIGRSLAEMSELLGTPCTDFAIGFGRLKHVSAEAITYLQSHCRRVYLAVRGLNVPGKSPAFFCRTHASPEQPLSLAIASAAGALDHRDAAEVAEARQKTGLAPPTC